MDDLAARIRAGMWSTKWGIYVERRDRQGRMVGWVSYQGRWYWDTALEAGAVCAKLQPSKPNSIASKHLRYYVGAIPPGTLEAMRAGTYSPPQEHIAPSLDDELDDWAAEAEHDRMLDEWDAELSRRREHDV